ncbi:PIN domain protein [Candidatus Sulfopaludibacter sp. SbA3]|nr:PIN domain protein [Candidatus Sulfopaludibacter sp. SbA3]
MIVYVDTQVAVLLAEANLAKISRKAISLLDTGDVRISPMAVVELQYLYEIRRIVVTPPEILMKLSVEIGLTVCDHPFPIIAETARGETWTRDPFDRIIVSHAKANSVAPLLTKDELILANYSNARW